jgi:urea transport system permease protein
METFVIGLSIASILFMVALGLAIIYGTMKVINLAHGEMVMIGAYTTVLATKHLGFNLYLCIPLAFLVTAAFGYVIERTVVRRLYGRLLDTLLATWGIALILQQLIRIHFGLGLFGIHIDGLGSDLQNVPVPSELQQAFHVLGANIPVYRAFIFVMALLLGAVSWWLIFKTRFGNQLRAVSVARNTAAACGINDKRVNTLAFAYGSGLAGIAGVLVSGFKTVSPDMGTPYVVDAFLVVVAGGVGHLTGTLLSAGILGEVQSFVAAWLNDVYGRTVLFSVVILILLFKPQGLFVTKSR